MTPKFSKINCQLIISKILILFSHGERVILLIHQRLLLNVPGFINRFLLFSEPMTKLNFWWKWSQNQPISLNCFHFWSVFQLLALGDTELLDVLEVGGLCPVISLLTVLGVRPEDANFDDLEALNQNWKNDKIWKYD